jgi:hypothetical protein
LLLLLLRFLQFSVLQAMRLKLVVLVHKVWFFLVSVYFLKVICLRWEILGFPFFLVICYSNLYAIGSCFSRLNMFICWN